jgi:hypothetical protein
LVVLPVFHTIAGAPPEIGNAVIEEVEPTIAQPEQLEP